MIYIASLFAGLVVGVVYGLINLRSPAPPIAALIGLLGMLAGENGVSIVKGMLSHDRAAAAPQKADYSVRRADEPADAKREATQDGSRGDL